MSKERKVFLENLPKKKGVGYNKNKLVIDWKNSIGYKVHFVYDDIEGDIEIINYVSKGQTLTIKYKDKVKPIETSDLSRCGIGGLLNKYTNNFKV